MKTAKYSTVAYIVKSYFLLLLLFCSISTIVSIVFALFDTPAKIPVKEGGAFEIGGFSNGIPVKMSMAVSIPKLVIERYDKNGKNVGTTNVYNEKQALMDVPGAIRLDTVVTNEFLSTEQSELVKFSKIDPNSNEIVTRVKTKDVGLRLFWIIYDGLERIFWIFICIVMIKIINRYLENEILTPRTFKLINCLGWGFVIATPIEWIFTFANAKNTPSFSLLSQNMNEERIANISLSLGAHNSIDFGIMLIGFIILILSQVIKEAVLVKKEIEFTI